MTELSARHHRFLDSYDLGEVCHVRLLGGGMFARPAVLTTSRGRFVLRGTRFRPTLAAFDYQADAMNHAAGGGIRGTRVLRDRDGGFGQVIDGAVWWVGEYLEGETCDWPRWWQAKIGTGGFIEDVARQVAELHDILAEARPSGDSDLSPELPPIQFAQLDRVHKHWNDSLDQLTQMDDIAAKRSRDAFVQLRCENESHWQWLTDALRTNHIDTLPRQIVHGDVSPVNFVFQADSSSIGFVDWDNLHMGLRLYDALGDVVIRPPADRPEYQHLHVDVVRRYVDSYRRWTSRPVTDGELACIGPFCLSRQLEDLRQRLAGLATLPADRDDEYAALIEIRVRLMDQIRQAEQQNWTCPNPLKELSNGCNQHTQ